MSEVRGLKAGSPFTKFLGDLPTSALSEYVYNSWLTFQEKYKNSKPSFQKRSETQLTQALSAFLRQQQDKSLQPFGGDFFGELSEFVLDDAGLPKCIARTDIEWRLHGVPGFIVEFKILDGKKTRRDKYLVDGVMRFVVGRYGGAASAGAMFGLLRLLATNDPKLLLAELEKNLATWRCIDLKKAPQVLSKVATFDTTHDRIAPNPTPFHLAHLFVSLSQ